MTVAGWPNRLNQGDILRSFSTPCAPQLPEAIFSASPRSLTTSGSRTSLVRTVHLSSSEEAARAVVRHTSDAQTERYLRDRDAPLVDRRGVESVLGAK